MERQVPVPSIQDKKPFSKQVAVNGKLWCNMLLISIVLKVILYLSDRYSDLF